MGFGTNSGLLYLSFTNHIILTWESHFKILVFLRLFKTLSDINFVDKVDCAGFVYNELDKRRNLQQKHFQL